MKTLDSPTALGYTLGAGVAQDQRSEADIVPDRSFRVSVKPAASRILPEITWPHGPMGQVSAHGVPIE